MRISSRVVDGNNQPVPGAHILFETTYLGTITNINGEFSMTVPDSLTDHRLSISSIGFKTKFIPVRDVKSTVQLVEDQVMLQGVVIVPRDYAREAVEKAIAAIPQNYPNREERLRGFIREITYKEAVGREDPYWVAETVVESVKEPYDKKQRSGDVTIIEGRNYQGNRLDTLPVGIYAGSHHAHRFDAVSRREEFLSKPDKYKFEILDTVRFRGSDAFRIGFSGKNKPSGEVLILDSSFAIISYESFEVMNTEIDGDSLKRADSDSKEALGSARWHYQFGKRMDLYFKATYDQGADGKWRLLQTDYLTRFSYRETVFVLNSNFVTTDVYENKEKIPYVERVHYFDHLLLESHDHDPEFWNDYNVVLADATVDSLFAIQKEIPEPEREIRSEADHRTRAYTGVIFSSIKTHSYRLNYLLNDLRFTDISTGSREWSMGFNMRMEYEFKDNWFLGLSVTMPNQFFDSGVITSEGYLATQINLNPQGRPVYLMPAMGLGYYHLTHFVSKTKTEDFRWEGGNFNNGEVEAHLGLKGFEIMSKLGIGVELGGNFILCSELMFHGALSEQAYIAIREPGILMGSEANRTLNDSEVLDTSVPFTRRLSYGLGIYRKF